MSFYDKIVRPTTQMLLKRMDTNPEEFDAINTVLYGSRSWATVVKNGEFNLVESVLIKRKMKGIHRKATEQRILELLLDGQAREESYDPQTMHSTMSRFSGTDLKKEGHIVYSPYNTPTYKSDRELVEELKATQQRTLK